MRMTYVLQVYFLDADKQPEMHRMLHHVPALVIDYDTDFDLQDKEAKDSYAEQVKDYFEWVELYRCESYPCQMYFLEVKL